MIGHKNYRLEKQRETIEKLDRSRRKMSDLTNKHSG